MAKVVKRKLSLIRVLPVKGPSGGWEVRFVKMYNAQNEPVEVIGKAAEYATKGAAMSRAKVAIADWQYVTLRIHRKDGTFQREYTYPRSADPKSKG